MKDKEIIKKQEELIEHLMTYYGTNEYREDYIGIAIVQPKFHQYLKELESELTALKSEKPIPTGEIDINFFDNEKGDVSIEFNGDVIGFIKTKTPAHFFNNLLSQYVSQVQPHSESENPKIGLTKTRRDENR
jgi:hypothetical protein